MEENIIKLLETKIERLESTKLERIQQRFEKLESIYEMLFRDKNAAEEEIRKNGPDSEKAKSDLAKINEELKRENTRKAVREIVINVVQEIQQVRNDLETANKVILIKENAQKEIQQIDKDIEKLLKLKAEAEEEIKSNGAISKEASLDLEKMESELKTKTAAKEKNADIVRRADLSIKSLAEKHELTEAELNVDWEAAVKENEEFDRRKMNEDWEAAIKENAEFDERKLNEAWEAAILENNEFDRKKFYEQLEAAIEEKEIPAEEPIEELEEGELFEEIVEEPHEKVEELQNFGEMLNPEEIEALLSAVYGLYEKEKSEVRPEIQVEEEQPEIQVEEVQPELQVEEEQPEIQVEEVQPEIQVEEEQPEIQVEEVQPELQVEEEQPVEEKTLKDDMIMNEQIELSEEKKAAILAIAHGEEKPKQKIQPEVKAKPEGVKLEGVKPEGVKPKGQNSQSNVKTQVQRAQRSYSDDNGKNNSIRIRYMAKEDVYIIKDVDAGYITRVNRSDLHEIDKGVMAKKLSKIKKAHIDVEDLKYFDTNVLQILYNYNKAKAKQYYNTMLVAHDKSKDEIMKIMSNDKLEISYDLRGLYDKMPSEKYDGKSISLFTKREKRELLDNANKANEKGIAQVKKGPKVAIMEWLDKISLKMDEKLLLSADKKQRDSDNKSEEHDEKQKDNKDKEKRKIKNKPKMNVKETVSKYTKKVRDNLAKLTNSFSDRMKVDDETQRKTDELFKNINRAASQKVQGVRKENARTDEENEIDD